MALVTSIHLRIKSRIQHFFLNNTEMKQFYARPLLIIYEVKTESFICTSGDADSEREDYIPEDWDE